LTKKKIVKIINKKVLKKRVKINNKKMLKKNTKVMIENRKV
jgi:hypothetical protein